MTRLTYPQVFRREIHTHPLSELVSALGPIITGEPGCYRVVIDTRKPEAALRWLVLQTPGIAWQRTDT